MAAKGDSSLESERAVAAFESWSGRNFLISLGPFLLSGLFSGLIDVKLACFSLSFVADL